MENFEHLTAVTRRRYVTRVGGKKGLLGANRIALYSGALFSKTRLSGGERVTVRSLDREEKVSHPPYTQESFVITLINEFDDSRLLAMASDGEAVLSSECLVEIEEGESIEVNSSLDRLPRNWVERLVKQHAKQNFSP